MEKLLVLCLLVIYSWQDIRRRQLSLWTLAMGFLLAIIWGLIQGSLTEAVFWNVMMDVFQGMAPGCLLFLLSYGLKGRMGKGDGIVLAIIGTLLGFKAAVSVMATSLFLAFAYGCILLLKGRRKGVFPFVPFYFLGVICLWRMGG